MLNEFDVITADGRTLSFLFNDVSQGYAIDDISGLDPGKATLVSSSFALLPGEKFQASKREKRNIVLRMLLKPDYVNQTVKELRTRLYQYFMIESLIRLRFKDTDGLTVIIDGVVESFESPLFSKEPAVDISIICHNPDFSEEVATVVNGSTTSTTTEILIDYDGTIPTGFEFALLLNRSVNAGGTIPIHHRNPSNVLSTITYSNNAPGLVSGNVLTISTVIGNKFARLQNSSGLNSVIGRIDPQSSWSQLLPGENYFRVALASTPIPYTITYFTKYGGL